MGSDVTKIQTVTLEILRPGPAHNQLLSPLTNYVAICGDEGPVTLQIEFEHARLLSRLGRLRYRYDEQAQPIRKLERETEVRELGADVGKFLARIPTLHSELGRASLSTDRVVHLRLVISGSELSMIPFELVISSPGLPGEGLPLLLQQRSPVTITREVRRGRPLSVRWDRTPKILFIAAQPQGLHVPQREHLHAIRQAMEPWVNQVDHEDLVTTKSEIDESKPERAIESITDDDVHRERIKHVRKQLYVLLDASIEDIRRASAEHEFTHIHILAHGGELDDEDGKRYGVVLCKQGNPSQLEIIDGRRLAEALQPPGCTGIERSRPAVVTLATQGNRV